MIRWKTVTTLVLAVLLLTMAGCVRESLDNCPGGYRLVFYYPGNGSSDIFPRKIDHVELLLYGEDGRLVRDTLLSRESFGSFQGVELEVPAGDYTAVCWGNMDGYSRFTAAEPLAAGRLYQSQYLDGSVIQDFDSLYFSRRNITVDNRTQRTDTLTFTSAHISMEIYIEGYEGVIATRASGQGIIEVDNISVGYDFGMTLTPEQSVMYPVWESDEAETTISAKFNLLRFYDDTPIVINVRDRDGGDIIASVDLAGFLEQYGIDVEGVNEITVPVYIIFGDNGFRVSVEPWDTLPVIPVPR